MFIWLLPSNKTIDEFYESIRRSHEETDRARDSFAASTVKNMKYVEFDRERVDPKRR